MKYPKINLLTTGLCLLALAACQKSTHVHTSSKSPHLLEVNEQLRKSDVKEKRMVKKYHSPKLMLSDMVECVVLPSAPIYNAERYAEVKDNPIKSVGNDPLSTFSIDVDTASYSNMRRQLNQGRRPQVNSIRVEELINYFSYDYPQADKSVNIFTDWADCPWNEDSQLVRVAIKGKEIKSDERRASNLVFLIDVSGSMGSRDKLPLLKESFMNMVERLDERDKVSIVVYAGAAGVVLTPTECTKSNRDNIMHALDDLNSGGSTNGSQGIERAYELAQENFLEEGNNRIILATDGDFNVGASRDKSLVDLIKEKAQGGVYLTVLGFGSGNLNDSMMEKVSNAGNGNYFMIDSADEGDRVLCEKLTSTLVTVAKDVKIQVEFNPAQVSHYRLIGYANRHLKNRDFTDDKKDAGDLGAGDGVTALYEIQLVDSDKDIKLKYQQERKNDKQVLSNELMTVKVRYKPIGSQSSTEIIEVLDRNSKLSKDDDFKFATQVAAFGQYLSKDSSIADYEIEDILEGLRSCETSRERREFVRLVKKVRTLME
jgi:Ca-activated chloride channel homolog